MSDRQTSATEETSPDVYHDNTDEGENAEAFAKVNNVNVIKTCSNVLSSPQPLGSAHKRNVTSISDDEVHGRRRKNRRHGTVESNNVSSNESVTSGKSGKIDSIDDITSSPALFDSTPTKISSEDSIGNITTSLALFVSRPTKTSSEEEPVQESTRTPEKCEFSHPISRIKKFPLKTENIEKADINKSPLKSQKDTIKAGVDVISSATLLVPPSTSDPSAEQEQIQEARWTQLRSKIPRPVARLKKLPIKKEGKSIDRSDLKKSTFKDGVDNIISSPTLLGARSFKQRSQRGQLQDANRIPLRSKIPRLTARLKTLPIKEESKTVEANMKKSSAVKDGVDNIISSPTLLGTRSFKQRSQKERKVVESECSVTESLPTLVNNSEDGNEKTPKRKPNTPVSSPSKARLTPTNVDKLKTHWRLPGKKITAKSASSQKMHKRVIKSPNVRPAFQESNKPRSATRGSYVSTKQTINTINKNVDAEKKSADLNHSSVALKDQSHKLSILGARYRIQLKRFNTQSKDLLGLTIMLESTRKTLIVLGEQITTLGGEVPPGDLEKIESSPAAPNSNTSKPVGKIDKGTSASVKEVPDIGAKLQEENKALLIEIKKLQELNATQVSWFCKNINEMKILENGSLLTDVKCKEALNRQSELGHKLRECDKAIKELVSLNKDASNCKANISKLKNDLNEEKTKLETERISRSEQVNKLNQELNSERGKLKSERVKREALQSQLTKAINERNSVYQEKLALIHQIKELEENLLRLEQIANENNEKLHSIQQTLVQKEEAIKIAEATLAELNATKITLENQIVDTDAGSKSAHSSIIEMSKQLLNKDELMTKIKSQRDQAFSENTALSELLHFLAALNCLDISMINFDEIINDSNAMAEIKEKIKEACRKPNSTITESLVREQAEQIKEQAINIQKFREEVNKQNEQIQELLCALNLKENEIVYLKAENCRQPEKMEVMEIIEQKELFAVKNEDEEKNENEAKEVNIDSGSKVTRDQLLTMLVAKSTALARMESKMKQLELVHSMCARRRARGESRIAQLESILQSAINKKIRETADKSKNLQAKSPDKQQGISKHRILHSGTLGKEETNKGNLLNNYKCQLMKFNKTWTDVQQKQDSIKATYSNLKKLRSLIMSENLPLPRPIPIFRFIESLKDEEEQTESVISQSTNCESCEHENLLIDMKLLVKQKEELAVTVTELKDQLEKLETQHLKEPERKEPVLMKNQEVAVCLMEPLHSDMESSDGELAVPLLQGKQMLNNGTSQLIEERAMVTDNIQCECYEELARAIAEAEKFKMEVEQSNNKFNILEGKFTIAQLELDSLKEEKFNWTQKVLSLEVKKSQTQAEFCEMYQFYEGLCALKVKEENNEALGVLKMRFQNIKAENHEMDKLISKLQNEVQQLRQEKEFLQECLNDTQKREIDLEKLVKKLKKSPQVQVQYEEKGIQISQDVEFKKKLK